MSVYTIYGDSISGNCLKVKWTADLLGLEYDWREISVLAKETRTDEFLALNSAGQVPVIVRPDGSALAQSNAIVIYLLRAHNSPLLPEEDLAYGNMLQWMFWEQYTHEPAIAVRRFHKHYMQKPDDEIDPSLLTKGNAALQVMQDQLVQTDYIAGPDFTAADIALVAYTRFAREGGFDLSAFPAIGSWIGRVEHFLGLSPLEGAT